MEHCVLVLCMLTVFMGIQYFVESKMIFRIPGGNYMKRPFDKAPSSRRFPITDGEDPGKPLFLTPYIEAGNIEIAQNMSKVRPAIGGMTSYSGYLTVNKTCGSNLFFWYFPAQDDSESAPVVLWLQGGPGSSSMYGLFEELGPFNSFPEGLKKREYSWNVQNNLLFIDQPVGTGYSFTENGCYAKNDTDVGIDLYDALCQFFKLFPDIQKNKFFITGESYAGHYIPAIGHTIHVNNPTAKVKINLSGMMIGNGWCDAREQIGYAEYLYQTGLISYNIKTKMEAYQNLFVIQVDNQQWTDAGNTASVITEMIRDNTNISMYNFLPQPKDLSIYNEFIQNASTRKAIHVGSYPFDDYSEEVSDYLADDVLKSVKPWVQELLENYTIIFYNGQVDIICAYPMEMNFLRSLKWSGQDEYLIAKRKTFYVENELAGYYEAAHNLYAVLVRDAGHMVPANQPLSTYQLVNAFTHSNITCLLTHHQQPQPNDIFNRIKNK